MARRRIELDVAVFQTVLTDYRIALHQILAERFRSYRLYSGDFCFDPSTRTMDHEFQWTRSIVNRFMLRRNFLWQSGSVRKGIQAEVAVLSFNLRILSTFPVLIIRRLLRRPTLLWGHVTGRGIWSRRFGCLQIRCADGFISYTNGQAAWLQARYPRLPTFTAPNACLHARDCFVPERTADRIDNVIFVGRFTARKKPMLVVNAFKQAIERKLIPETTHLDMVGTGPLEEALRISSERAGLNGRVRFHGHISDVARLRELHAEALFSVSPGYVGLSAIQSFGFGVPMLIADNEPHSPEIELGCAGVNMQWFQSDDPGALAEAMGRFFVERTTWIARRESIARAVRESHTFEAMAQGFERAVIAVASRRHSPKRA